MVGPITKNTFLERSGYRRRRMRDVARVLPIVAIFPFHVPLLWPKGEASDVGTSDAVIYLFVVWALLILATGGLLIIIGGKQREDT